MCNVLFCSDKNGLKEQKEEDAAECEHEAERTEFNSISQSIDMFSPVPSPGMQKCSDQPNSKET